MRVTSLLKRKSYVSFSNPRTSSFPDHVFLFFFYIAIPSCNIKKYFRSLSKEEKKNREIVIYRASARLEDARRWSLTFFVEEKSCRHLGNIEIFFFKTYQGGTTVVINYSKKKNYRKFREVVICCNCTPRGRAKVKF